MYAVLKRPFILLEVLIACALVILCAIPLLYPHVEMLKAQREFTRKVELDHAVNLLYGSILEKLYLNKINWPDIMEKTFEIDQGMLQEAHYDKFLPYRGSYQFIVKAQKPKQIGNQNIFLFDLIFNFVPQQYKDKDAETQLNHTLRFKYKVFIGRNLGEANGTQGSS